ncbi:hypothetical protein BVC80_1813g37 [Macleaya cordata]|uniref:Uncharacterized protein n=1 Tax=Macleaya cordata TaxID=56857 RepID=A0A200QW12_MACCD|nr:hypothetical protein BVC80_1813g37 [Macleaya cordata]
MWRFLVSLYCRQDFQVVMPLSHLCLTICIWNVIPYDLLQILLLDEVGSRSHCMCAAAGNPLLTSWLPAFAVRCDSCSAMSSLLDTVAGLLGKLQEVYALALGQDSLTMLVLINHLFFFFFFFFFFRS